MSLKLFLRAQEIFEKRKQRYDPDYMLRVLDELYRSRGMVRPGLLRLDDELPSSGAYARDSSDRSTKPFRICSMANAGRLARTFTNRSAGTFLR